MRFMPPAATPHREASLGLGGVGEPMRCTGCSLRRLLPPPHVGEHGSHVRHEQNPNHSPCQNVHNFTPYASARLSPWCDQRGWFLAHPSLLRIRHCTASAPSWRAYADANERVRL